VGVEMCRVSGEVLVLGFMSLVLVTDGWNVKEAAATRR
jgi:hypothetical protein